MGGEEYGNQEDGLALPLITEEEDSSWALEINKKITLFGITPIAFTGIILNSIVICTWTKCSLNFHVHIFLFKSLAVADMVFTSTFCAWYYTMQLPPNLVLGWITFTSRIVVVNITFILSLYRWVAIKCPLAYRTWSSQFRARLVLGAIIAYCILLRTIIIVMRAYNASIYSHVIREIVMDQAVLTAPCLVQFILSIDTVRRVWQFKLNLGAAPINQIHRKTSMQRASKRNRHLTGIIVSISVVTFLAYPVGDTLVSYFRLARLSYKRIVFASANVLYVTHSSINFFIYIWFMPEFGDCLKHMCCSWRDRIYPEAFSTSRPRSIRFTESDWKNTYTMSTFPKDAKSIDESKLGITSELNDLNHKTQITFVSPDSPACQSSGGN